MAWLCQGHPSLLQDLGFAGSLQQVAVCLLPQALEKGQCGTWMEDKPKDKLKLVFAYQLKLQDKSRALQLLLHGFYGAENCTSVEASQHAVLKTETGKKMQVHLSQVCEMDFIPGQALLLLSFSLPLNCFLTSYRRDFQAACMCAQMTNMQHIMSVVG